MKVECLEYAPAIDLVLESKHHSTTLLRLTGETAAEVNNLLCQIKMLAEGRAQWVSLSLSQGFSVANTLSVVFCLARKGDVVVSDFVESNVAVSDVAVSEVVVREKPRSIFLTMAAVRWQQLYSNLQPLQMREAHYYLDVDCGCSVLICRTEHGYT